MIRRINLSANYSCSHPVFPNQYGRHRCPDVTWKPFVKRTDRRRQECEREEEAWGREGWRRGGAEEKRKKWREGCGGNEGAVGGESDSRRDGGRLGAELRGRVRRLMLFIHYLGCSRGEGGMTIHLICVYFSGRITHLPSVDRFICGSLRHFWSLILIFISGLELWGFLMLSAGHQHTDRAC